MRSVLFIPVRSGPCNQATSGRDQTHADVRPSSPSSGLSPTPRTTIGRGRNRMVEDRADLHALLEDALVAHLGVVVGGHPVVLPTAFAVDPRRPGRRGTLYVRVGRRRLAAGGHRSHRVRDRDRARRAGGRRSAFHHSMNYRSAVVIGTARPSRTRRRQARARPGRRPHDPAAVGDAAPEHLRKELAATAVCWPSCCTRPR